MSADARSVERDMQATVPSSCGPRPCLSLARRTAASRGVVRRRRPLADEGERIALMVLQNKLDLGIIDLQSAPPVHLVHLIHSFKAKRDPMLALDRTIDVALLQPNVVRAAHAVASLCQGDIWVNLHPQVGVVEVGAGENSPDAGHIHSVPPSSRWVWSLRWTMAACACTLRRSR